MPLSKFEPTETLNDRYAAMEKRLAVRGKDGRGGREGKGGKGGLPRPRVLQRAFLPCSCPGDLARGLALAPTHP